VVPYLASVRNAKDNLGTILTQVALSAGMEGRRAGPGMQALGQFDRRSDEAALPCLLGALRGGIIPRD
jgi:hypothetical protein